MEMLLHLTIEAQKRPSVALVLLFSLWCCGDVSRIGFAAESVQNGVDGSAGAKKLAILIGVKKYNRLNDLKWCDRDVKLIAKTLRDYCQFQDIVEMTGGAAVELQPTRGNIMAVLQERLQSANDKSYSQVMVFFAGHGLRDKDDSSLYLLPQDFALGAFQETGVRVALIRNALNECVNVPVKLLVLDTCHAGETRGPLQSLSGSTLAESFRTARGLLTLASCQPNEESLEWNLVRQGLFTFWLCEGLRGEADRAPIGNGDGIVDTRELNVFVSKNVQRTSQTLQRDQRPVAIPSQHWKAPAVVATLNRRLSRPRRESKVAYHVIQSQKYRNGGNYKAAIDELVEAFKVAPNNANLFAMRASFRLERGLRNSEPFRLHAAVEDLNRAFSHVNGEFTDHDIAAFYSIRSKAQFHLNQFDEALKAADQVIRLHASSAQAFRNRAKIYDAMGRQQEADGDAKEANRLDLSVTKLNQTSSTPHVEDASIEPPPASVPIVGRGGQQDGDR